jgi:squalene-hopene/tetraprenyl-beta-curcumene cyclase
MAYINSPRKYNEEDDPFVRRGIEYILEHVRPNGSIYKDHPPSYNTVLAILALESTKNPQYKDILKKAQNFVISLQSDEEEGYRPTDKYYGGIGYGGDERPDLANLQFAIEALKASGVPMDNPVWAKAIRFIERTQNRSESNDQSWVKEDGGFIYSPKKTFVPGHVSYGSMTFAGIKSLLFANVSKDDPRIKDAIEWVKKNWTLDENPNFGLKTLYFYYRTLSIALSTYGERIIKTEDGVEHDWYKELAAKIMILQSNDGYWINSVTDFWEGNKDLVSAHAIMAMETEYDSL